MEKVSVCVSFPVFVEVEVDEGKLGSSGYILDKSEEAFDAAGDVLERTSVKPEIVSTNGVDALIGSHVKLYNPLYRDLIRAAVDLLNDVETEGCSDGMGTVSEYAQGCLKISLEALGEWK